MTTKKTPLYDAHVALGGRMVEFAGYDLPVQYTGLMQEHKAVRERCGLFDVSHMGEIEIRGPRALQAGQWLVCGDLENIVDGQALYTGMLNKDGGFVDDLIVYRYSAQHLFLVVNAANRDKDFAWVQKQVAAAVGDDASCKDMGEDFAQIAIQGPKAEAVANSQCDEDLSGLKFFHFTEGKVCGKAAIIGRTGYTGEDGFELYCAPDDARAIWDGLMAAGADFGIAPAGLGARDTLRLEAKLSLYGNDIDEEHSPLEAGLGWIVAKSDKDFCGRQALQNQRAQGLKRRLVGFEMVDRGIPRHGYPIVDADDKQIGVITSGTHSPTLGKAIALGYVPKGQSKIGREHFVKIRDKKLQMRVIKTPFYKRPQA